MRDFLNEISEHANDALSDPDPVRRAQIQMKRPLPKRFYKDVSIGGDAESGFSVLLDGKTVKTPARKALSVPTQALAELVAAEWEAQVNEVDPARMPVTRLVNTALDAIAADPLPVRDDIVRFCESDLLCYRADTPEALIERQAKAWDPIIEWAASALGARFILVQGIMHQTQPLEAVEAFAKAVAKHENAIALASLHTVTTLTGSALLTIAFAEGHIDADTAWHLSHVDEDWTTEHWGEDAEATARRAAKTIELQAAAAVFRALAGAA